MYLALLAGVFFSLYYSTIQELVRTWLSTEEYHHGFLIFPISAYLVWVKRGSIFGRSLRPSRIGILFLLLWAALFILGKGADISTFERISLVFFLLGCVFFMAGRELAGILTFPILFLLFMIPIPAEIYSALTSPLALMATSCSVSIFDFARIPALQEGNLIYLPNYSMEVLDACSGIRSLISIIALALLMGYRVFSSFVQMACLLVISIPVSIIGNIFRITVTGLFAYLASSHCANAYSHTVAGISQFFVTFLLLLAGGGVIRWVQQKRMQYISWYLR